MARVRRDCVQHMVLGCGAWPVAMRVSSEFSQCPRGRGVTEPEIRGPQNPKSGVEDRGINCEACPM